MAAVDLVEQHYLVLVLLPFPAKHHSDKLLSSEDHGVALPELTFMPVHRA